MTQDILQQICVRDKFKVRAKNNILAKTMYKEPETLQLYGFPMQSQSISKIKS